jgi:hypothetical protein
MLYMCSLAKRGVMGEFFLCFGIDPGEWLCFCCAVPAFHNIGSVTAAAGHFQRLYSFSRASFDRFN